MKMKLTDMAIYGAIILLLGYFGNMAIEVVGKLSDRYRDRQYRKELWDAQPVLVQTIDGCGVYRFYEGGRAVYFSKCGAVK